MAKIQSNDRFGFNEVCRLDLEKYSAVSNIEKL